MSVRVENVSKRFGAASETAVDDVSFDAEPGTITTLLGPSGSGKSTILRLIAGLEVPDGGRIAIGDQDVSRLSPQQRNVGFVFQGYALFRHMTVLDNIAFGLRVRGQSRAECARRVRELLRLVQLPGYEARFPGQLSGGQRQRVALARALAIEPKVLLLDEPFGALDAQVRVELRQWLLTLHRETQLTTLLVTHDQEEALELSGRVVLLNHGRVEQTGSPHELYDHPHSEFVASFLGGANVLRARVAGGEARIGSHSLPAPSGARDGTPLQAFVRPHNVRLRKGAASDPLQTGRVERLTRVGGYVKVYVSLPTGESITVQMSKTDLDDLDVEPGDGVAVDLLDPRVFLQRYSI